MTDWQDIETAAQPSAQSGVERARAIGKVELNDFKTIAPEYRKPEILVTGLINALVQEGLLTTPQAQPSALVSDEVIANAQAWLADKNAEMEEGEHHVTTLLTAYKELERLTQWQPMDKCPPDVFDQIVAEDRTPNGALYEDEYGCWWAVAMRDEESNFEPYACFKMPVPFTSSSKDTKPETPSATNGEV